jgi:hypothetical protein
VLHISDVGSGTGSNLIYFLERFPQNQYWYLVEQDAVLNQFAFDRVVAFAKFKGYTILKFEFPNIHLQKGKKEIYIEFINGSLLALDQILDLDQIDLVTAGAVFDLFSVNQFHAFAKLLLGHKCSLLTTLNYTSMRITPHDPASAHYIELYEAHMQRPQGFGKGMGKSCAQEMISLYKSNSTIELHFGESHWNLPPNAQTMHHFLLGFMKDSIESMIEATADKLIFKKWIEEKKRLSKSGSLRIDVNHIDIFAAS